MRYILALILVVTAVSSADARHRRAPPPSPGPLVCGFFWNWHPPCSQADIIVGSTLYGAGIGGVIGAAVGGSAAIWTGVGIGAGTGLVAPVVLVH